MLSHAIMIAGFSLLSAGFLYRKKEDYFKDLYDQIERSNKFHLDFVDQLGKLPINKNIILFGSPKSETNKEKILYKSIIKRGFIEQSQKQGHQKKQFEFPKQDRLWKFSLKEPFYFQTLSNQKIFTEQDENLELYAFNLLRRNFNQKWQERVIVKNEPICAYGKISKSEGKAKFKVSLIMGTKNQNFLSYLDDEIIKLRSKGKNLTLAGTAVFVCHIIYQLIFAPKANQNPTFPKTQKQQILEQINKFQNKLK